MFVIYIWRLESSVKEVEEHHENFSSPIAVVLFGARRHVSVPRHVELSQSRLILSTVCPLLGPKSLVTECT